MAGVLQEAGDADSRTRTRLLYYELCMMGDGIGGAGYYLNCLFFYLPFCLLFSHVCSLNFQALQRCMQGGSIKQNLVLWGIVISYITPVYPTLNCGKAEC